MRRIVLLGLFGAALAGAGWYTFQSTARAEGTEAAKPLEKGSKMKQAIFAEGCFWGVEAVYRQVDGVTDAVCGYTGGHTKNPSYEQVCRDSTGHAEAVLVTYDPDKITYEELLNVFWKTHDPTTKNQQGPDYGTQYRSAIFCMSPEQEELAKASMKKLEETKAFPKPITTEIAMAGPFYKAEEYHQKYFEKHGVACHMPEL